MLKNPRQTEEDLESDDELPSTYYETPDIPAYKNDRRFDTIEFPWVQKYLQKSKQESTELRIWKSVLYSTINEETVTEKTKCLASGEKLLIIQGVLSQCDILCLKSLESSSSDSMLLWLVNFLMYKDLQSKFKFLRTCLVESMFPNTYEMQVDSCSKVHHFEIVVEEGK